MTQAVNRSPSYPAVHELCAPVSADGPKRERPEQIVELYGDVRSSLKAYLSARGLSDEQSEDVIQEAFLRLVGHRTKRESGENLRAWLFRVAHNLCVDHHRTQRRRLSGHTVERLFSRRECRDPAPDPEQKIILRERHKLFLNAYSQLTPRQRRCLQLRAGGLRYHEIGLLMGVSVQRVGELLQAAISRVEQES